MPFLTQDIRPIPSKDILSWYFDEPKFDPNEPIYIDADHPERSYSLNEAKTAVKQIAAGLKTHGLKKGDTVCLHSFNDVQRLFFLSNLIKLNIL